MACSATNDTELSSKDLHECTGELKKKEKSKEVSTTEQYLNSKPAQYHRKEKDNINEEYSNSEEEIQSESENEYSDSSNQSTENTPERIVARKPDDGKRGRTEQTKGYHETDISRQNEYSENSEKEETEWMTTAQPHYSDDEVKQKPVHRLRSVEEDNSSEDSDGESKGKQRRKTTVGGRRKKQNRQICLSDMRASRNVAAAKSVTSSHISAGKQESNSKTKPKAQHISQLPHSSIRKERENSAREAKKCVVLVSDEDDSYEKSDSDNVREVTQLHKSYEHNRMTNKTSSQQR